MSKSEAINEYARLNLDKLRSIRTDVVREDKNWKECQFPQLTKNLIEWLNRNLIEKRRGEGIFKCQNWVFWRTLRRGRSGFSGRRNQTALEAKTQKYA